MDQFENETKRFIDDLKNGQNNILVAVRVRPLNNKERTVSEFETIKILDGKVLLLLDPSQDNTEDVLRKNRNKETQFAFDFVFDQWTPQQRVYENTTAFLIDGALEGFNTTVFSYGATGSGKTYTMIGSQQEAGIMPRSLQFLFTRVQDLSTYKDYTLKCSYVEIYNENIRDLLTQEDKNLDIREDKNQGITIAGVVEVDVKTVSEVMSLLKVGNKNRTKESTDANKESSRSHAILQLSIESKEKASGIEQQIVQSKLSLVDLAGSERAANTNNKGIRMQEGAKINQSLLVLGNCIQSLSEANEKQIKNPFIPFRNSKLTRLLKDSLGGNCRTVMISNVSAALSAFEETYNTLIYANRAKNIKTAANRNVLNAQNHISNYAQLIQNLRQENEELKALIQHQQQAHQPQQSQRMNLPQLQNKPGSVNVKQQVNELEQLINQNVADILEAKNKLYDIQEQQAHFTQNILFLQQQKARTQDKFEQMRLLERVDNAKTQKQILQRSYEDLQQESLHFEVLQTDLQKQIQHFPDGSYKGYLQGIMKQGELKIESLEIKHQEKRTRNQEAVQDEQVKQLRNQIQQQQKTINSTKKQPVHTYTQIRKSIPRTLKPSTNNNIPGVDSPFPSNGSYSINQYKYQQKKSNLKLPPVLLSKGNQSPKPYITKTSNHSQQNQMLKYRQGQRYSTRGYRPPSYRPPSSSKQPSAQGRYQNKSLDLGNSSSNDLKTTLSMQRIKRLHQDYQAERFERALSGRKKQNQNSLPFLGNKILLPGMVHKSPYVKNFQQDNDTIEMKKERLKRLNINLKGENGHKFQINI